MKGNFAAGVGRNKTTKAMQAQHRRHANVHRVIADQHEEMGEAMPHNASGHKSIARLHRQIADHHEKMAK